MPVYDSTGGWIDLGTYSGSIFTTSTTGIYNWPTTMSTTWSGSTTNNYIYTWNWGAEDRGTTRIYDTHEQVANHHAARRDQLAQREASRTQAVSRAEELLLSLLNEEQRESYSRDGSFTIVGSHGGRYKIERGVSGNILWVPEGNEMAGRLCAHPTMNESWLPTPDVQVAQMLALITDEPSFINLANVHAGRRPDHLVAA